MMGLSINPFGQSGDEHDGVRGKRSGNTYGGSEAVIRRFPGADYRNGWLLLEKVYIPLNEEPLGTSGHFLQRWREGFIRNDLNILLDEPTEAFEPFVK